MFEEKTCCFIRKSGHKAEDSRDDQDIDAEEEFVGGLVKTRDEIIVAAVHESALF